MPAHRISPRTQRHSDRDRERRDRERFEAITHLVQTIAQAGAAAALQSVLVAAEGRAIRAGLARLVRDVKGGGR